MQFQLRALKPKPNQLLTNNNFGLIIRLLTQTKRKQMPDYILQSIKKQLRQL